MLMRPRLKTAVMTTLLTVITACSAPVQNEAPQTACSAPATELGKFIEIPAGQFSKGAQPLYADEGPTFDLHVDRFWVQTHEVTNAQFSKFVEATDYVTDAEQGVLDQRDGAGSAVFRHPADRDAIDAPWALVKSASWQAPEGDGSSISDRAREPVVHVSKRDAEAYAAWAGGRLPSEVEWEYAATLGLPDSSDSSSGAYGEDGPRANTWQGVFPVADIGSDGFTGVAPIGCFEADRVGLHDMIGNVWEWTDTPYGEGTHTMKGGSFLCADNFCRRYRPAARHPQDTDFSSNHIGFRIVRDSPPDGESET